MTAYPITASELERRLAAVMGDAAAVDLLDSPNASLGGLSPIEALDAGHHAEVVALLAEAELGARAKAGFIRKGESL